MYTWGLYCCCPCTIVSYTIAVCVPPCNYLCKILCVPLFRRYHGIYVPLCLMYIVVVCVPLYFVCTALYTIVIYAGLFCTKTASAYRWFQYSTLLRSTCLLYNIGHLSLLHQCCQKWGTRWKSRVGKESLKLDKNYSRCLYSVECCWHRRVEIKALSEIAENQFWNLGLLFSLTRFHATGDCFSYACCILRFDFLFAKSEAFETSCRRTAVHLFVTSDTSALGKSSPLPSFL